LLGGLGGNENHGRFDEFFPEPVGRDPVSFLSFLSSNEEQRRKYAMKLDSRVKELIALGTSVGANCHPCLNFHVGQARELGIGEDEISEAIDVGKMVRKGAGANMDKLATELLGKAVSTPMSGCGCK
jgi:AhpD family alkylhydroperoxidase